MATLKNCELKIHILMLGSCFYPNIPKCVIKKYKYSPNCKIFLSNNRRMHRHFSRKVPSLEFITYKKTKISKKSAPRAKMS